MTTLPADMVQSLTEEADRLGVSLSDVIAARLAASLVRPAGVRSGIEVAVGAGNRSVEVSGGHRHTWGPRSGVTGLRRCTACGDLKR
jgi:hypothetical protein